MGKIIFFEDRNFGGRSYECMGDCSDLHSYLQHCHSIRVESGCWMMYDRPNFMGHQYFMRRGEYPDYMRMMGMNDCARSCRMIPMQQGSFRMRFYDHANMAGRMTELAEDCPNMMERFRMSDVHSCNVMGGHWLMYEQPHYAGRQYYLRPGEYKRYGDWGGMTPRVGSIRRVMDL